MQNVNVKGSKLAASLILILLGVSACVGCSKSNNLPSKVPEEGTAAFNLKAITGSDQTQIFREVTHANLLPKAVIDQLGAMADVGQPFNSTDMVDPKVPSRGLAAAAVSKQYCIVSYWQGGIALYFRTLVFELSDGKAKLIWISNSQGGLNFRDLKAMVESGRMHNDLAREKPELQ